MIYETKQPYDILFNNSLADKLGKFQIELFIKSENRILRVFQILNNGGAIFI